MASSLSRKTGVLPTVTQTRPTGRRTTRYPKHTWYVKFRPFDIQPMVIAPVAAGDTVKHLRFEGRVLTDPIKSQIVGWWSEMYFFYVRFSDLEEYTSAQRLAITVGDNLAGLVKAANTWTMHNGGGPDWLYMCMKPIIQTYFRAENRAWNDAGSTRGGIPMAGIVGTSWLDTLSLQGDFPTPPATDDYAGHWAAYEQLRKAKLVTMDYPEYLASQGVAVPEQLTQPLVEKRRPEMLRFVRQFTYPTNTVKEDGSGSVSAASWVTAERMDRAIFCDEPGFIVGVSLVRPKMYRNKQTSTGASLLRDARSLVPDMFDDAPQESLVKYTAGVWPAGESGPITSTGNYWVDVNGLYCYGDQFVAGETAPSFDLPGNTDVQHTYPYPTSAIDNLFVDTTTPNVYVRSDGTCSLSIVGRKQITTSPQAVTK